MMLFKKGICYILCTMLLISELQAQVKPASVIPEFKLYHFDKTAFTRKDLAKNKLIFILFFDATCEHCKLAVSHLNQLAASCKNAAIYLVSMDDKLSMMDFLNKNAPELLKLKNTVLLHDESYEIINKFKPRKYPSIFLYDHLQKLMLYSDDETSIQRFADLMQTHKM